MVSCLLFLLVLRNPCWDHRPLAISCCNVDGFENKLDILQKGKISYCCPSAADSYEFTEGGRWQVTHSRLSIKKKYSKNTTSTPVTKTQTIRQQFGEQLSELPWASSSCELLTHKFFSPSCNVFVLHCIWSRRVFSGGVFFAINPTLSVSDKSA